jgi:phosphotransacetylase
MSLTFADIYDRADGIAKEMGPQNLVLLGVREDYSIKAVKTAAQRGWIVPVIARLKKYIPVGKDESIENDIQGMEVISAKYDVELVMKAVALIKERNGILMRGRVSIKDMLHALLLKDTGFTVKGKILSHIGFFESEKFPRLLMVTDGGVNIQPNLEKKVLIVKNAVEVAEKIGLNRPKVALLAAIETIVTSSDDMVDDAVIAKMSDRGTFGNAAVDGPLSFDVALVPHAAQEKNVVGEVAGKADILVTSRIEIGNGLFKGLFIFGESHSAGLVVGGKFPVVMTSRSQTVESRMNSIALALILSHKCN